MRFSLEVFDIVPSANVVMRWHWAKRQKMRINWGWLIAEALAVAAQDGTETKRTVKKTVTITRCSTRLIDQTNLALGSDKLILDNLVSLGALVDDSPAWCDVILLQKVSKVKKTVIEVWEE